jgi:hypothetical protein
MTLLFTKELILFAFFAIVPLLHVPKCYSHLIINWPFQFYTWCSTLSLKVLLPCQNFPVRCMEAARRRLHDVNAARKKLIPEGSSVTICICPLLGCWKHWMLRSILIDWVNTNFKRQHWFSDLWPCNYVSSCFNFYTAEWHQIITQFGGLVIFYSENIQKNLFL